MTDIRKVAEERQAQAWEVVRDYPQFVEWEKRRPEEGIFTWMP